MSERSGFSEDGDSDNWANIRWSGAINSAIKGKRGQEFLRKLLEALDAMPVKELVYGELEVNGSFCALGVAGQAMGLDLTKIDTYDWNALSKNLNIAAALARQIMWVNDNTVHDHEWEWNGHNSVRKEVLNVPGKRWQVVRDWVVRNIELKKDEDA